MIILERMLELIVHEPQNGEFSEDIIKELIENNICPL